MTDSNINIKVSVDTTEAAAKMKQFHKVASTPNSQAVKQQATIAKGNAKAQQQTTKSTRTNNTQIKQIQQQNKALQQQNKLIQQNIRLQQQAQQTSSPGKLSRMMTNLFGGGGSNAAPSRRKGGSGGSVGGGGVGGGGSGASRRGGGGGAGMWMLGGAAGIMSYIAGRLVNMVTSQIAPSDEAFTNFAKSSRGLRGIMGGQDLRGIAGRGGKYGYTELEGVQQMRGVARATGSAGDLTTAQAMSRSMGMDVGEVSEHMGMLTRAGEGGKGTRGERALQRLMSSAVSSGLDRSRAGEHLQAVASLVEAANGRSAGTVNASDISGLLAFFSKSGQAGLQGARGASVLSQVDQTITSAGFGTSGGDVQALIMRAMGFGTGGNASFYDARKSAQQGIFGEGGAKNLRSVFGQFDQEYGTGQGGNLAVSESMHLSLDIVEQIRELIRKGGPNMDADIASAARGAQPVDDQILSVLDGKIDRRLEEIARTETQQITQGSEISGYLDSMRNDINDMVRVMWPALRAVMDVIAEAVSLIADFVKSAFRGTFASGTAERKMGESKERLDQVTAAGSAAEKFNAYQTYLQDLDNITSDLRDAHAHPGWGTALTDTLTGGSSDRDTQTYAMMNQVESEHVAARAAQEALRGRSSSTPEELASASEFRQAFGIDARQMSLPAIRIEIPRDPSADPGAHRTARPAHTTAR